MNFLGTVKGDRKITKFAGGTGALGSIDQYFQRSYPNAIEYGKRGENLIASFFFRATVCAILLALFWGGTVYVSQTRQIKKELFLQAEKAGRNLIEDRSVPFSETDTRIFENLIEISDQKLTDEEFAVMQTHVELGAQIVKDVPWLVDSQEVIRFHHERCDGSGYPFGRTGEQIPLVARIFAVVDVFDALVSQRPYKSAFSYVEAIEILKQEARQFDPWVLKGFWEISEALYNETALMGKKELENHLAVKLSRYFGV
jgi:hypothetical protein